MAKVFEKNNVSIKVNNFLKSKARKYMVAIQNKSEEEIRALWKKQSILGNVGPLMYAIVSYEDSSIELLHEISLCVRIDVASTELKKVTI